MREEQKAQIKNAKSKNHFSHSQEQRLYRGISNTQTETEILIGDHRRTLKTYIGGFNSHKLIYSTLNADDVLQAIAEFLKKEETEYEMSEKTYKIIINEKIQNVDKLLKYQINLTRKQGEADIIVIEFQKIAGDEYELYKAIKKLRDGAEIENV